jgi:hypothetical protein
MVEAGRGEQVVIDSVPLPIGLINETATAIAVDADTRGDWRGTGLFQMFEDHLKGLFSSTGTADRRE